MFLQGSKIQSVKRQLKTENVARMLMPTVIGHILAGKNKCGQTATDREL